MLFVLNQLVNTLLENVNKEVYYDVEAKWHNEYWQTVDKQCES